MHAERHLGERARNRFRIRHRLQEVATNTPEHIDLTALSGVKLLWRRASTLRRDRESIRCSKWFGVARFNGKPSWKRRRIRAHLCATLHAAMPTDRHQSGARAADVAARKSKVDDRGNVLAAAGLLRDPHRPDQDCRFRSSVERAEGLEFRARRARHGQVLVNASPAERRTEFAPSRTLLADELLIKCAELFEPQQRGADEGDVPPLGNLHPRVGHLRAEEERIGIAWDPVALKSRLAIRVHHQDLRAALLGEVQILHEDWLRVRHI